MKLQRPILTVLFSSAFFIGTLSIGLMNHATLSASIFRGGETEEVSTGLEMEMKDAPEKTGEWTYCDYQTPELPQYNVELESLSVSQDVPQGGVLAVDMIFKNTGDTRLFSWNSGCVNVPMLSVGTQKQQDRISLFSAPESALAGWTSGTRIAMDDPYADPGQSFHVRFESIAPAKDDIYREFFQPVVEGQAWIGEIFAVDIPVGTPTESMKANLNFVVDESLAVSELEGLERNLLIDLSDQMMRARFGEKTVWSMQISSGAWDTPTPTGNYEILTKQELRIGAKWPHYRMPYFQLWDWRGYGIHALPYLANDGGTFWSEAWNHIGIPVSHGCIRTLPDDAVKMYEFTEIGTPLTVQR
ncbi:L,D-transpeptidase [Candidatus Peregrinibacteria bacterium]|nr:MAG: L,D-transpeptidase [Candidatus Peregrinibacteria bacterium]